MNLSKKNLHFVSPIPVWPLVFSSTIFLRSIPAFKHAWKLQNWHLKNINNLYYSQSQEIFPTDFRVPVSLLISNLPYPWEHLNVSILSLPDSTIRLKNCLNIFIKKLNFFYPNTVILLTLQLVQI
jgi:hypothetical protein